MSVYGRVRCPICYELADSKTDLAFHMSVSHHGIPFDPRATVAMPVEIIEAEDRALMALKAVSTWEDSLNFAEMISRFPAESFLWDLFLWRVVEVMGYLELTNREVVSNDKLRELCRMLPTEKVSILTNMIDAYHALTRHEFPNAADTLQTLRSTIYHTLIKSDLDDNTSASTTFADQYDWRYARLACQVPNAAQQSLICTFMERYRFELVSRERLSRALSTEGILRVGTCREMINATKVTAFTLIGSFASDAIAHVAVDFQFGKRSVLTVHESGMLYGFTDCLADQWYIDLVAMYVLGALVEAMLEPEFIEAKSLQKPHSASTKGAGVVTAPLTSKKYDHLAPGGSHTPPGQHLVRPHLRWVGPEYILDAERRRQAQSIGLDPKQGYTLVHGHSRGLLKVEEYTDANGKRVVVYRAQRTELHLGRIFS